MSSGDPADRSGAGSLSPTAIDRASARYLLAIADLSTAEEDRITTGDIQNRLDVTAASVSEKISKLDDRGWVDYEKYYGVTLTNTGEKIAERAAWRVCIVAGFFESELGMTLDERTAFEIGFLLPVEGIHRLRESVTVPCLELCPESNREFTSSTA